MKLHPPSSSMIFLSLCISPDLERTRDLPRLLTTTLRLRTYLCLTYTTAQKVPANFSGQREKECTATLTTLGNQQCAKGALGALIITEMGHRQQLSPA